MKPESPAGGAPGIFAVLGACEVVQGMAQHFTGKWSLLPPWVQIAVGAVVFTGNAVLLVAGKLRREPDVPQASAPAIPPAFPARLPPPSPAFIFRRRRG